MCENVPSGPRYATAIGCWSARHALMISRYTASIAGAGLARGMPGPVSRGDVVSIEKHLASLQGLDPALQHLYRELCTRSIALGLEAGGVDEGQAGQLRTLLDAES